MIIRADASRARVSLEKNSCILPSEKQKKILPLSMFLGGSLELFLHMLMLSGQDQPTMESMRIVILPGLDGTDLLLARFIELVPVGFTATVMPLPDDPADDYESLSCALASRLRDYAPCHLVAESFSGPVGIRIASRHPDIVNGLTLVASFASSPAPLDCEMAAVVVDLPNITALCWPGQFLKVLPFRQLRV
jgi:pimeloyl-ACP methyl ester carboxylesterase